MKKLVIISHTEHFRDANDVVVGWGPTVREVNYLAAYFTEVVHIATLHADLAPNFCEKYDSEKIRFVGISPFGGKGFIKKIGILTQIRTVVRKIKKEIANADYVQLRLPTSIGVYLLPCFAFIFKRNFVFWVKYAGNWNESSPPISYGFQRWFLKRNFANCKVTINGNWMNQPSHCLSFENPCLTSSQLEKGTFLMKRGFTPPFRFLFVGRLEDAKGVSRILDVFVDFDWEKVSSLIFIGDGKDRVKYEKRFSENSKVKFYGSLKNEEVHAIMMESNFLLLPSSSEGFPKVIAEAACYGVIPIVSNVGSVSQYITHENGFVFDLDAKNTKFKNALNLATRENASELQKKSSSLLKVSKLFSFENYFQKLTQNILSN